MSKQLNTKEAKPQKSRTLLSGRIAKELDVPKTLSINTACPEKFVAFDLETGELWQGSNAGVWKRATIAANKEVVSIVKKLM